MQPGYLLFTQLSICTWDFFFLLLGGAITDRASSLLRASVACLALSYCALALAICPAFLSAGTRLAAGTWGVQPGLAMALWGLTLPWEAKL